MRTTAMVALFVSSMLANPYIDPDPANVETGVLLLWPTARSTALAGAMTGLADEADATYFSPAGLAFQTTAKADVSYGHWLPGRYEGMSYAYASSGAPLRLSFLRGRSAYLAGSLTYMTLGETDIVNEHGDFLGRVTAWQGAAATHAGLKLTNSLGIGLGLKLVRSSYYDWWYPYDIPSIGPRSASWMPDMNTAIAAAADIAVLYRPFSQVSIGAVVANLGPRVVYQPSGASDELPRMARLGLCWKAVGSHDIQLCVMPELDKLLVGMFKDTTGRKPFRRRLEEEWKDVWKALGIEATVLNLVSLRLGYFEDLTNQRGGIVLENKDGRAYHYGVWDVLTRKNLGEFRRIGLCWGFGIGSNKLRFDLSSDAAIYDFQTTNWKLQLTCNDLGRLFRVGS